MTRQCVELPVRQPRKAVPAVVIASALLGSAHPALADDYLPAFGREQYAGRGPQLKAPCAPDQNLVGVELRVGEDVDAIRPLCARAITPRSVESPALTTGSGLVRGGGPLPLDELAPGWYGGPGGGITRLLCPNGAPVVNGMEVGLERERVNNVHLYCGRAEARSLATA